MILSLLQNLGKMASNKKPHTPYLGPELPELGSTLGRVVSMAMEKNNTFQHTRVGKPFLDMIVLHMDKVTEAFLASQSNSGNFEPFASILLLLFAACNVLCLLVLPTSLLHLHRQSFGLKRSKII